MKRLIRGTLFVIVLLCAVSCSESQHPGLPENARLLDEVNGISIWLCLDDSASHPKRVTLYSFDDKTRTAKQLLSTDIRDYVCNNDTAAFNLPKSRVASISKAKIISRLGQPLIIAAYGSADGVNVDTYIIREDKDSAICLPYSLFVDYLGSTEKNYFANC